MNKTKIETVFSRETLTELILGYAKEKGYKDWKYDTKIKDGRNFVIFDGKEELLIRPTFLNWELVREVPLCGVVDCHNEATCLGTDEEKFPCCDEHCGHEGDGGEACTKTKEE